MLKSVGMSKKGFNRMMNYESMLIASFSVFAVVFATMLYSMHKIKKENSIDALKTDMV